MEVGSSGGDFRSQEAIALKCGIGRTHVPRALKPLIGEDLVEEDLGRIPGKKRRLKVYSLTGRGDEKAREIMERINEEEVVWTDDSGREMRSDPEGALSSVNRILIEAGRERIPISLFLSMAEERITWNDILWISGSLSSAHRKEKVEISGWKTVRPPRLPGHLVGREKEMETLRRKIGDDGRAVVFGERGIGKRTLIAAYLERSGKRGLWLEREETEITVRPSDYDSVVLVETSGPDPEEMIMGPVSSSPSVDIPPELEDKEAVSVRDWPDPSGDGLMLEGIERGPFVDELTRLGLDEDLAEEIFTATKGSPASIAYLRSVDPSLIRDMDREKAIFSILLGTRDQAKDDTNPSQKID